ncbi:MAG: hypothetical protein AAF828_07720 [Bacteroidota bacterium]
MKDLSPTELDQLERYVTGTLAQSAIDELKTRIAEDAAFAEAVAVWEAVHRIGMTPPAVDNQPLREQIATIEAKHPFKHEKRRTPVWIQITGIAALLLGLFATAWYFKVANSVHPQQLAEQYFIWLPREDLTLGANEPIDNIWAAYDAQNYQQALPQLKSAVAAGTADSSALIFAGVAALGVTNAAEAETLLKRISPTSLTQNQQEDRRFYLGLALLQQAKVTEAEQVLLPLSQRPNVYQNKVIELLEAIKNKKS